jgi:hypothetical protein
MSENLKNLPGLLIMLKKHKAMSSSEPDGDEPDGDEPKDDGDKEAQANQAISEFMEAKTPEEANEALTSFLQLKFPQLCEE